jgi:sugar phosphate isomerase/epimerase
MIRGITACVLVCVAAAAGAQEPKWVQLFAPDNLVAWCIVPFDAKKRGPEERVAMLKRLGFKRYAYDWRAEHLPTYEHELSLLKDAGIELQAVWFPARLDAHAQRLLAGLKKHNIRTQLWVAMSGGDVKASGEEQRRRVAEAVTVLRPIVEAAAELGCMVALYNHGGWFGEPENQIEIIKSLGRKDVGIVYNLHHGHAHLDRFGTMLEHMKPHLVALNLNGMHPHGDRDGKKIWPVGHGSRDLVLLKTIVASGWQGPVGILGHTQDDVEERLLDNLEGLRWLSSQLGGKELGPRPKLRTIR